MYGRSGRFFFLAAVAGLAVAVADAQDTDPDTANMEVAHAGGSVPILSPHVFPAHLPSEEPDDDVATKPEPRAPPMIHLIGPKVISVPVLRTKADKQNNEYHDMGAKCVDKKDGLSGHGEYPLIEVAGEVVNLARTGTYSVTFRCANSAGKWAAPVKRTVVVTGTFLHDCKTISVTGIKTGKGQANPQAHRMGTYVLNNYYHGRPEYRQQGGSSWLYFRSNFDGLAHSWVIDGYDYFDMRGLHIESDSDRPDMVHGAWSFLNSMRHDNGPKVDASWVKDPSIKITCTDTSKKQKLIWYPHFDNYNGQKLAKYKTKREHDTIQPKSTPIDKLEGALRGATKALEKKHLRHR